MTRANALWLGALALLGLAIALPVLQFKSSREFDGEYASAGQLILADGQRLEVAHRATLRQGRFYSLTRRGQHLLELSGRIDYGFLGRLRLHIEARDLSGPADNALDASLFAWLQASQRGAQLHLERRGACLYGHESQLLLCPAPD